jgi:exodeoxyribonuclease VII large subunit
VQAAAGKLNALSPLATLERGFAIVRAEDGHTIRSAQALTVGEGVAILLRDGAAAATITATMPNDVITIDAHGEREAS